MKKKEPTYISILERDNYCSIVLYLRRGNQRKNNNNTEAMARRFGRAPFTRAAVILSCVCFTAFLAAPTFSQASLIAILSQGEDSGDAFIKIVDALCEKGGVDEEGKYEQNFCRKFEDEREVSSLLMQNAEAFAAVVTEVRGMV